MCFDARKTKHSLVRRLLNIARAKTTSSPFLLGSGADTVHLTRHTRHQREFTVTACRQSHSLRTPHTRKAKYTRGWLGGKLKKQAQTMNIPKLQLKKKKRTQAAKSSISSSSRLSTKLAFFTAAYYRAALGFCLFFF